MTVAVELSGVTKRFRRGRETIEAVAGIDLSVAEGEFLALVGPSGCGKSTLLRLVAGLLDPDDGRVIIGGVDPHTARAAKGFGLVPQTPALLPWRSVRANISLLLELNRTGSRKAGTTLADGVSERLIEAVGVTWLRAGPACGTLRRNAATSVFGPGIRVRGTRVTDGRTVRRAR